MVTAPFDDYVDEQGCIYWSSLLHLATSVASEVVALMALVSGRV